MYENGFFSKISANTPVSSGPLPEAGTVKHTYLLIRFLRFPPLFFPLAGLFPWHKTTRRGAAFNAWQVLKLD